MLLRMDRKANACLAACMALFAFSSSRAALRGQEPRIRAEVNLVNLVASVVDATGRPVPDLPREAFEIYEEGVKQAVDLFEAETSQPLDLALMIDTSLSTYKELAFEREAAAHFIRQVVRPGDRVSIFEVSDTVTQLVSFSADVQVLQSTVRKIGPGTGSSLYDAIYLAGEALGKRERGRRRVMVLVTDAGETTSRTSFESARRAAVRSEAMLYTILIRPVKQEGGRNTAGEHALINIAEAAGGTTYYPDKVDELDDIFDRIDRELRTQYRLGYYPSPRPPAGSFRRIELRIKPTGSPAAAARGSTTGYILRYRKGYFTDTLFQ
jgi:Ca-activated chloride channel family protein